MKNVQPHNCYFSEEQGKRGMFEGDLIEGELEIGQTVIAQQSISRTILSRNDCRRAAREA
jgi:hypothetical protein